MAEPDYVYRTIAHSRDLIQSLSRLMKLRPYNLAEEEVSNGDPGRDTESFDGGLAETSDVST
jgi:hypothetical protein